MGTDQLLQELKVLPPEERARIAEELFASLDESYRAHIETLWAEETERRIDALDRGELREEDGPTVMERLRNRK